MDSALQGIIIGGGIAGVFLLINTVITIIANNRASKILDKQTKLDIRIDGRMEELLELTRKLANAEGNKEGRAEKKQEDKLDKE